MHNVKRTVLITIALCLTLTGMSLGQSKPSSLDDVMARVKENLDRLKSYIIKSETHGLSNVSLSGAQKWHPSSLNGRSKFHCIQELRYDGKRFSFSRTEWGDLNSSVRNILKKDACYHSYLWDGKNTYQYDFGVKSNFGRVFLTVGNPRNIKFYKYLFSIYKGSSLMGYFTEDTVRIDEIASQAKSVKMRESMEPLSGSNCYVIEIESRHGDYTIWIDPDHGYNIAKAQVLRDKGDIWIRDYRIEAGEQRHLVLSDIKFLKVDNQWIPVEVCIQRDTTFDDGGYKRSKEKFKVNDITINPDHEALKSFVPDDISDGSSVQIVGNSKLRYLWQDGVVVDKKGNKIDIKKICKEQKNIEK